MDLQGTDMEKLVTVREIFKDRDKYIGSDIAVGGWVRSVRDSKTFGFIVLNDGSYFETLQIVYHDDMPNFAAISKLNVGSAIIVRGKLVAQALREVPGLTEDEGRAAFITLQQ